MNHLVPGCAVLGKLEATSNLGPSGAALGKRRDPDIVLAHLHLDSTWGDVKPSRTWEEFYQQKFHCYWRQGYTAKVFGISTKIFSFVDLQFCNLFLKSSIVAGKDLKFWTALRKPICDAWTIDCRKIFRVTWPKGWNRTNPVLNSPFLFPPTHSQNWGRV